MKFKQKIMSVILSSALFTSSIFVSNANTKTQQLEVHFINVGQGDATYIELPDGTDILIDAGDSKYGTTVANYLKKQEKDIDIEYLIATHPDSDHIGGMQEVFKQLNIKNFYYPIDAPSDTQTWKNVLNLSKAEGCNILDAKPNASLNIGEANIRFIHPNVDYTERNDDSVVTLVSYCDKEVLITGDIESEAEQDMVSKNLVPDVDILKVAHHGSKTSSSQAFLNKANPEHSVISVGKENNYGHPNSDVINRLISIGSNVWRTDVNGDIVAKLDCRDINITANGNPSTGGTTPSGKWIKEAGYWYFYKNGVKQKGWVQDGGKWYYLNTSGVMQTGWQQVGTVWYYLKSNGAMATGWEQVGNKWYYLKSSGAMATGWEQVNNKWYYLNNSGAMQTGWQQVGNKWYYLETSGVMATGWKQLGGKWYYLNNNGAMQTGWQQIQGKWYYFYGSGVMATNTTIGGWKINASGVGTPVNNGSSNSSSSNNSSHTSNNRTVYVTPSGKSYHYTKNCTTLKRSKKILSVTLQQAKAQGKSDPCNICVR